MSPGCHARRRVLGVDSGCVSRWARPPQSMHVMTAIRFEPLPRVMPPAPARSLPGCAWWRASCGVGGWWRRRPATTRPTTDKVREAVFNALASLDVVVGARSPTCTPAAARSGIEALSRGAAHCTFVERDRAARRARSTRTSPRSGCATAPRVVVGDAIAVAPRLDADLAFADPPYGFDDWPRLLRRRATADARRRRGRRRGRRARRLGAGAGQALRPDVGDVPARWHRRGARHYRRCGTHGDRAQPRQLRPDPPRPPRRRRAGRRAVRPRHRRRDAQPREAGRAVRRRRAHRADRGERRRRAGIGEHGRRVAARRPGRRRRRGGRRRLHRQGPAHAGRLRDRAADGADQLLGDRHPHRLPAVPRRPRATSAAASCARSPGTVGRSATWCRSRVADALATHVPRHADDHER